MTAVGVGIERMVTPRGWTASELATVREMYADTSTKKIARKLPGRRVSMVYRAAHQMGLRKSTEYLASADACRLRRGDEVGKQFRYPKGHVPANAGKKMPPGWAPGRSAETRFKKGERSGAALKNWCPVGTIRIDGEGYMRIKVRESNESDICYGFGNVRIWPLMQRHLWVQHRGPIPPGHAVIFMDGDRSNCAIENLDCISRVDLMRRNTIHRLPAPLREVIILKGAIRAVITKRRKKAA